MDRYIMAKKNKSDLRWPLSCPRWCLFRDSHLSSRRNERKLSAADKVCCPHSMTMQAIRALFRTHRHVKT